MVNWKEILGYGGGSLGLLAAGTLAGVICLRGCEREPTGYRLPKMEDTTGGVFGLKGYQVYKMTEADGGKQATIIYVGLEHQNGRLTTQAVWSPIEKIGKTITNLDGAFRAGGVAQVTNSDSSTIAPKGSLLVGAPVAGSMAPVAQPPKTTTAVE